MIPLVNPAVSRQTSATQPWLGGAVRWIVVVLALVATVDAVYLTWTSFSHGVVFGCDGASHGGCDDVLTSAWSRAAGLPVALGGLLCYGTILALALAAGSRSFNENRVLGTLLVAAALLAALSGLWFTVLQVVVLSKYCYYCLAIHLCGLVMASLVLWSALRSHPQPFGASQTHASIPGTRTSASSTHASASGTRTATMAIPGARRPTGSRRAERPVLAIAAPLAVGLLGGLIAVQMMFPAKTFDVRQPELAATIDMTAAADASVGNSDHLSPDAQPHVVNRPTDDEPTVGDRGEAPDATTSAGRDDGDSKPADTNATDHAENAPKLSREVEFLKDKFRLDVYNEAVLGSPDAKYVVVEMMDYTCPHCRKMHAHMLEAMDRYGDQLAIVILPVPLELSCNKLVQVTDPLHRGACKIARTALAVADVDPSKFRDFHNFLLADEEKAPSAAQAVVRAFRLVDRKELMKRSGDPELDERIQKNIRLYSALLAERHGDTTFGLPVQIVGDTVLSGGNISSEEMFAAWEKALGIKPL
jgi:uncharacterized membrane protein/protein-disulfide isomerase